MGTNFFLEPKKTNTSPNAHIGKRSAAGMYCWDCNITLCRRGNEGIHTGYSSWHSKCPLCKKQPTEESVNQSSVGRELGFNKTPPAAKTGICSCSSFTWALKPEEFLHILALETHEIVNEYGEKFTMKEFKQVLKECPVQYHNMIGREFS